MSATSVDQTSAKRIFLHIGTHKTGTTSLQNYLWEKRDHLRSQGYAFYEGIDNVNNHVELHMASMRYERETFAKQIRQADTTFDAGYTQKIAERVQGFIKSCSEPNVILTNEGLSQLRHPDELDRLMEVLGCECGQVTVVFYLRNKVDFLESYKRQMRKRGRKPSQDYWSALYVEPDTWLIDFETLVSLYREKFGPERVVILDYDEEMRTAGNVIPSFLRAVGLVPDDDEFSSYFCNQTLHKGSLRQTFKNVRRRFKKGYQRLATRFLGE